MLAGTAFAVIIAFRWPRLGATFFRRMEKWGRDAATHKMACVFGVCLLVIALRLSFLPWLGIPLPEMHDEFCHLLAADTFVHGRLTNPPIPVSEFLSTFFILQSPTYMSTYPPGQGAVLALGQLLGNPWFGVVLSMACMCAAITWCLQAWVPPRWALLGGIIAAAQFGASNNWMEHYFGGAVPAIGGALIIGALPRLARRQHSGGAFVLALGVAILATSRPYEGVLFCAAVFAVAGGWIIRERKSFKPAAILRLFIPFTAVMIATGAFIAYDNWRVTGNPFVLPWSLSFRDFFSSPTFLWQKLQPPLHYDIPQFASYFMMARAAWLHDRTWPGFMQLLLHKVWLDIEFYAPPQIGLPIAVSAFALRKNLKVLFSLGVCVFVFAGTVPLQTAMPHYLAPTVAAIYLLMVLGLRYLRCWKVNGRPVGVGIVRALVLFHVMLFFLQAGVLGLLHHRLKGPASSDWDFARSRAQVQHQLENTPGHHLVIVRYAAGHDDGEEWVHNPADIDHAKVVWARDIPGKDIQPLLDYFKGRKVWIEEPDMHPPRLMQLDDYRGPLSLTAEIPKYNQHHTIYDELQLPSQ